MCKAAEVPRQPAEQQALGTFQQVEVAYQQHMVGLPPGESPSRAVVVEGVVAHQESLLSPVECPPVQEAAEEMVAQMAQALEMEPAEAPSPLSLILG
mmetsp:Transcript_35309/g.82447  ORF Transcript_35309/g.82447 Transcript_35309/m.82447 type:complete len:97 (-) Transcript_35309:607-897(-)